MNMSEDVTAVSMQVSEKAADAALAAFKSVLDSVGSIDIGWEINNFNRFSAENAAELFRLLIGVSGIGVNSARMMLSSLTSDEIRHAILAEDVNKIKSVKGIGLKSAQRLVLELKDKIVKGAGSESNTIFKADTNALVDEATTALVMLGFTKANINKVMPSILKENPGARVEEIIKAALKKL